MRLAGAECRGEVEVRLRPLTRHEAGLTRRLPCVSLDMRTWRPRGGQLELEVSGRELPGDCGVLCVQSWLHWLHPAHWLDNVWPQARVVITSITLVIVIILFLLILKIIKSLLCLCSRKQQDKKFRILIRE